MAGYETNSTPLGQPSLLFVHSVAGPCCHSKHGPEYVIGIQGSDEAVLCSLGYRQEFRRVYGSLQIFGLAITMLASGPSMPAVLPISMAHGGAAAMVWGWAVCSLCILCVGMALAEIASAAPTAGGLYYLTYNLCSSRYRKILCWMAGFASTTSYVGGLASMNWGLSTQIIAVASIGTDRQFTSTPLRAYGIYAALIVSQAALCSLGTRMIARLQTVFFILNVSVCLAIVITFPVSARSRSMNSPSYVFGNITNTSGWPNAFAFLLGMLAPLWTIGGYDGALHMSEEVVNAAIVVPWTIISSIGFAAVFGFAANISLAFSMGTDIEGLLNGPMGQPMTAIALASFGKIWTLVLWLFILLALYASCANTLLVTSRQMFAFARDGVLPFSSWLRRFNRHTATPLNSVWFAVLMALILGLSCLSGPVAINAIYSIPITAQNIAFIIAIAARFLFENNFKPGPFTLGRFGGPVAVVAILFQILMTIVICFPSRPNPTAETMNYTSVVIGIVMLFALGLYYFPYYGAVHWFEGPVLNIPSTPYMPEEKVNGEKKVKNVNVDRHRWTCRV